MYSIRIVNVNIHTICIHKLNKINTFHKAPFLGSLRKKQDFLGQGWHDQPEFRWKEGGGVRIPSVTASDVTIIHHNVQRSLYDTNPNNQYHGQIIQNYHAFQNWYSLIPPRWEIKWPISSWWFQPIWKIVSQIGSFPQIGMNIKSIWNHLSPFVGHTRWADIWNHHLDIIWCIFSSYIYLQFLGWKSHQVTCWHLPQSVGRRHKRMKPMNDRKATLDQMVAWGLNSRMKICFKKISGWSWKLLTPKIDKWNTKDGRKSVVPLVPQFWAVQDASRNMTDTAVSNKNYTLFNIDTNNQALQKVCLL